MKFLGLRVRLWIIEYTIRVYFKRLAALFGK